jgi:DnaJ domain
MTGDGEALRLAIDLLHVPSRVRQVRVEPLPEGVPFLLRIAAGDSTVMREASRTTDRPAEVVRDAAAFFIEQILLAAESDSYRVLGASPNATPSELRHNMALLMKWLHPDSARDGAHSVFVNRVTMAWDDLKTPERRGAYDRAKQTPGQNSRPGHRRPKRPRRHPRKPFSRHSTEIENRYGLLRRAILFLLGGSRT